jgi:(1->4)-alpha-D-glucan 1-alpha-D-glucosylmutase
MYNPVSTYRLQFHKDFTLVQLDALLPYLQTLGITTIYASPIFEATPESSHGYDGVNPNRINPEIGTQEQLQEISQRLRQAGMGWIQDIVPNHMAYHPNNEWLMDVLEKGLLSRYSLFFESSLASSFFQGRILAPFLPESLEETIAKQELTLAYEKGRFVLKVSGNVLPLKPGSYAPVLRAKSPQPNQAVEQLLSELDQIRHSAEPEAYAIEWAEFRQQLSALMAHSSVGDYVQECVAHLNNNPDTLVQLADDQHYRFCAEPETRQVMNYRRFFTVNGLICLNMREPTVFEHVHRLTGTLLNADVFQGLRVDHVDGLFDPDTYLHRLRKLAGPDAYISVEKILQADEDIPASWPVQGTSGYDFLAMVNNLLTYAPGEVAFREFYQKLIGSETPLAERVRDRKRYFLAQYMGGELNNLYHYFLALNLTDEIQFDELAAGELKAAIGELLVACPVYRYYGNQFPMPDEEAAIIRKLLNTLRRNNPEMETAIGLLEGALLTKPPVADEDYNHRALRFYQRLMQFSGPLMAKGVEDTLMYTYNAFIGHNEVGDSPERFGMPVEAFHQAMQYRQRHWPLAQNTTATHDTKRGEDVRARLNVLTDLADEWLAEVQQWQQMNASLNVNDSLGRSKSRTSAGVVDSPDANDEYLIYQNLLGAYPMPGQDEDDFPNRFRLYLEKALQEAKRHTTGWVVEDDYHAGVKTFTDQLLDYKGSFWQRFAQFHEQIAGFGIVNSLTQVMLKMTCPGVPDIYQGGEGWDLSLVDPDNRRPVNFTKRQQWQTDLLARQPDDAIWADLWTHRFDGRIKFWLTHTLLHERQKNAEVFLKGSYVPLTVNGAYRDNLIAFARHHGRIWYMVVVPLHTARLCREQNADILSLDWKDTHINLPANAPVAWTNCLTGELSGEQMGIRVQTLLRQVPVALLRSA